MIKKQKLKIYHKIAHIFLLSTMIFGSVFGFLYGSTSRALAQGPAEGPKIWRTNEFKIGISGLVTEYGTYVGEAEVPLAFKMDCASEDGKCPKTGEEFYIGADGTAKASFSGYYSGLQLQGEDHNCHVYSTAQTGYGCLGSLPHYEAHETGDYAERDRWTRSETLPIIVDRARILKKWIEKSPTYTAPTAGNPVSVEFVIFSIVSLSSSLPNVTDTGLEDGVAQFKVKVFATKDELVAACVANLRSNNSGMSEQDAQTKCTSDTKALHELGKPLNATNGSNNNTPDPTTSVSTADAGCATFSISCFITSVIVFVVSLIREIIYTIFFLVILPILQAILSIRTYTDTFSSIIYPGWLIIRNVCNVFLILAMLIIGLATLFRVDGYNYKQLLVKVILAALFVNFSMVLGQAILGIADTIQNQFLPNATQPLNQLGSALMVGNVSGGFPTLASSNPSGFADIVFSIFQLALTIGSFIAFAAIAALLVVRLVALWILLMVSPVAWVADVLPATSKYRGEWWSNFLKYAFFAPIMGFFLNLTAVISLTLHDKLVAISGSNFANAATSGNLLGNENLSNFIFQVASNVLLIAFLVAAVMVAQSFGIKGADAAVSAVTKGLKSPFGAMGWVGQKLGSAAGRKIATKYDETTLPLAGKGKLGRAAYTALHLPSFFKASDADAQADRDRAKHLTEAGSLSVKRKTPFFRREGKDPLFHAVIEEGEKERQRLYGNYSGNETEEVKRTRELYEKAKNGDARAKTALTAQLISNAKHKHDNQWLDDEFGLEYNRANLTGVFNQLEKEKIYGHEFNEEFQTTLSQIGYETNNLTLTELSDGHSPYKVEEFTNAATGRKEFRYKGMEELERHQEEARQAAEAAAAPGETHAVTQQRYEAELNARLATMNAGDRKNAERAQRSILNAEVNLSKVDKLREPHHNALFSRNTEIDANTGRGKVVLGDAGKYSLTHLQGGDIWALGRGAFQDKKKDWFFEMLAQNSVNDLRAVVKKELGDELKRKGRFVKDADLNAATETQLNLLVEGAYASRFNRQSEDQIKADLQGAGLLPAAGAPTPPALRQQQLDWMKNKVVTP